jgi:hypothetical protein
MLQTNLREGGMSKFSMSVAIVILATALSATAYAAHGGGGGGGGHHGGGGGGAAHHGGGGGGGGGRHAGGAGGRAFVSGGGRHFSTGRTFSRSAARSGARIHAGHSASRSAVRASWHNNHARLAAHSGAWRHGGWRHRGGFGWAGPLYWPYFYDDFFNYVLWGLYDDLFWGYGYGGIYAGLFSPYGYDELTSYLPRYTGSTPSKAAPAPSDQLGQACGQDSRDIAGLPIDRFEKAIQPNEAQRTALDDLTNAALTAGQTIKTACPTDVALTGPGRLTAMQQRIEAMIAAVATVRPALNKFYDLLNDEQKARLTALGEDRRGEKAGGSLAQSCDTARSGVPAWPTAEIDRAISPTEAQRARLTALQTATAKAEDMLKASCQTGDALTPPTRLAAIGKRLDVMLQAVKTVRPALNDFYGSLTDEQKARFEAIGQEKVSQIEQPDATPSQSRGHRYSHIESMLRRLILRF